MRTGWTGRWMAGLLGAGSMAAISPLASAALVTFDDVVIGETSHAFDSDGDNVDDVVFSTTDPLGFNTTGPGANQQFIDEPGLEGTSDLDPDLRADFLNGATGSLAFGFALNSGVESDDYVASLSVFDAAGNLLGSDRSPAYSAAATFPKVS